MTVGRLAVLLGGRQVAEVARSRDGTLGLEYADEPGPTPISLSLRSSIRRHTGVVVEDFLRALVPDNADTLASVAREFGADPRDVLDVLSVIGQDCAGAVQFCRPDEVDRVLGRAGRLEPISIPEIEMRLSELDVDQRASWRMPGEHWSLGGTQAKFALRREADAWWLAFGSEPTTHIVKPGIRKFAAQAMLEHVSMGAAALLGLDVAQTDYVGFTSEPGLVVTRFDRARLPDGSVTRLHQEDLAQALGTGRKYEQRGGPSAATIARLLADRSPTAARARANVAAFADGVLYNTIIGAPDAHARNYAVLLDGDDVRLAPLFDVATGLAYDSRDARVASMSVGGTFAFEEVTGEHWRRFARDLRLDPDAMLARARGLAEHVPDAFATVLDGLVEEFDHDGSVAAVRARLLAPLERHTRSVVRG